MSSFAGVSVLADGDLCAATESSVGTGADCGYHLLVVQDYPRTKQEAPTGECITSRPFTVGGHGWYVRFYPNGQNQGCADHVSLDVSRRGRRVVDAKFVFSFVDQVEKQNPVHIRETETYSFRLPGSSWGRNKFVRRDVLERSANLRGNCFTIRCDIMVVRSTKDNDAGGGEALLPDIRQHFNDLFQTNLGADVMFEVGGETIAAHRCVLAARSKVFRAQLFGPMKEGTTATMSGVIQIKDMEANIFRALLSFVYTDSFPAMYIMEEDEMSEAAERGQQEEEATENETRLRWLQDLFVAADRYDLQRLKFICEKQLSERISVNSVMSTLALAEQHHCHGLKEAWFNFIQVQSPSCLQTLMASDGWEHIITTYPSVLNELIAKVIALNQQK